MMMGSSSTSRFTYDLYADYAYFDAMHKAEQNNLARSIVVGLADAPQPQRIFVPGFMNGRTFYPTGLRGFALDKRCQRESVLKDMVEMARPRGVRVYALIDCLRWAFPGTPQKEDLFERFPDLLEVNAENSCNSVKEGKFASPFHPSVQSTLMALTRELGQLRPGPDGILMDMRLSGTDVLGYSGAARSAYIREFQVDPIDLDWELRDNRDPAGVGHFSGWRRKRIAGLIAGMSKAFRATHPKGRVAVRGLATYYKMSPTLRLRIRQDWLDWITEGFADEVVFHGDWSAQRNETWVADANLALQKAGKRAFINPLLLARSAGKPMDLGKQWDSIARQVAWPHAIIGIQSREDFAAVKKFVSDQGAG